jgi:hypothetical protein
MLSLSSEIQVHDCRTACSTQELSGFWARSLMDCSIRISKLSI